MNKSAIRGGLLVALGLLLVLAALGIYLTQQRQDAQAGETADLLLGQLQLNGEFLTDAPEQTTPAATPPSAGVEPPAAEDTPAVTEPPAVSEEPIVEEEPAQAEPTMPARTVSGYETVGVLKIPAVGVELPILANWSDPLLKVAPCRYSGTAAGGDLILMGHNYRSHFKALYQVGTGDEVEFVDVNGVSYRYTVAGIERLRGSEGERLPSDYELSIFTCVNSGQNRLVLRCRQVGP